MYDTSGHQKFDSENTNIKGRSLDEDLWEEVKSDYNGITNAPCLNCVQTIGMIITIMMIMTMMMLVLTMTMILMATTINCNLFQQHMREHHMQRQVRHIWGHF